MQLLAPASTSRTYTPLDDESKSLNRDPLPLDDQLSSRQSSSVEEHDIAEVRRGPSRKGKERAWDEEMGPVEVIDNYPPVREDDQEERRVQDVSDALTCG